MARCPATVSRHPGIQLKAIPSISSPRENRSPRVDAAVTSGPSLRLDFENAIEAGNLKYIE